MKATTDPGHANQGATGSATKRIAAVAAGLVIVSIVLQLARSLRTERLDSPRLIGSVGVLLVVTSLLATRSSVKRVFAVCALILGTTALVLHLR